MDDNGVKEVAKTTGKALDVAKATGGFIADLTKGSLEQGMGIFEDKLKYMRWERQIRLRKKAIQIMKEQGLDGPTRTIPFKTAIPLLQAASMEEDDSLQDRWAKLLANAANTEKPEVRQAFIDMLRQMEAFDALIFEKIFQSASKERGKHFYTLELPKNILLKEPQAENLNPNKEVEIALSNLSRLGIITPAMGWGGMALYSSMHTTALGWEFYNAIQ